MTKLTTNIKIWGIVQGVGFRPFVAKLADRMGVCGEVSNKGGLVEIRITDEPERIDGFLEALVREKPGPAEIIHIGREEEPLASFDGFSIAASEAEDTEAPMIPADLAICPSCLAELADRANPRYGHPFISCMECGPRYTIIDRLPYDRENTAMDSFAMCGFCRGEYTCLTDRRYHAQTVSCHDCGPQILFRGYNSPAPAPQAEAAEMIRLAAEMVGRGEVIAVKSVGGYNLVCDPFQEEAAKILRRVKRRERKPFAVMFADMEQVRRYCIASETEERLLTSSARPIVLLERDPAAAAYEAAEFAGNRFLGAFLPSMGFQVLLLEACSGPLIATSANLSGMPMITGEEEMLALMEESEGKIAGIFYNLREIRVGVDDSVVRVIDGQPQMIRRAKGYAPVPLCLGEGRTHAAMLACGGQLKNAFALCKGSFSYVSQYFGDMESLESLRIYEENLERMKAFFSIEPRLVLCDMHPLYETTRFARAYAEKYDCELLEVQHHHAHVASVMAEHGLSNKVIGVSFDGTGYGTDGAVWGGEILVCQGSRFRRAARHRPVYMIGGDAMAKEGWKCALAYLEAWQNGYAKDPAPEEMVFDLSEIIAYGGFPEHPQQETVIRALQKRVNGIQSSSMGRLFDAVCALLGIKQENGYEGECAILLEEAAARALKTPGVDLRADLALTFHREAAKTILSQCLRIREEERACQVALTGGVFQNKILMEETLSLLRGAGFAVYYNRSVSPNDGGISLGQSYIGMQHLMEKGNR